MPLEDTRERIIREVAEARGLNGYSKAEQMRKFYQIKQAKQEPTESSPQADEQVNDNGDVADDHIPEER